MPDPTLSLRQIRQRIGWDRARLRTAIEDLEVVVERMDDEEASLTAIIEAGEVPPPDDHEEPDDDHPPEDDHGDPGHDDPGHDDPGGGHTDPPDDDPPSTVPTGHHPNEPAGLTVYCDPSMDRLSDPVVEFDQNGGSYLSVVQGPTPIEGRNSFIRNTRRAGSPSGYGAGEMQFEGFSFRRAYMSHWIRLDPGYASHPITNKGTIMWAGGKPAIYFSFDSSGGYSGPIHAQLGFNNVSDPAPNGPASPAMQRGVWHHWQMDIDCDANRIRWWLDGGLIYDFAYNVSRLDTKYEWSMIWGGAGDPQPRTNMIDMAEFYVSVR